jgi:hypothetical protein
MTLELVAPDRSLQQRLSALEEANRIRSHRAQVKRDVKAGRVKVTDLLRRVPPDMESMKLATLLLAVPKVGRAKADVILRRRSAARRRRWAACLPRQRQELVSALAGFERSGIAGTWGHRAA